MTTNQLIVQNVKLKRALTLAITKLQYVADELPISQSDKKREIHKFISDLMA